MSEYQEFTGKTVEEALRSAREAFGVSGIGDLDFEILTQGSRGVLGMGAEPARIIAAPRSALSGATPRPAPEPAATPRAPRPDDAKVTEERAATEPEEWAATEPEEWAATEPEEEAAASAAPTAPAAGETAASSRRPRPPRGGADRRRGDRGGGRSQEASRVSEATSAAVEAAVASGTPLPVDEPVDTEASPEALQAGQEILAQLVELMGYDARVEATTGPSARITVFGADEEEKEALGALIGRKGERLSALQHLVNLMLSRRMGSWTRVLVDVEDYRGRRERQLIEVAQRAADRVQETGQMLQLEPMSALERRWIHLALRDVEGIATQSIGEEPMRRVVVLKR